jgi:hypothetical protein
VFAADALAGASRLSGWTVSSAAAVGSETAGNNVVLVPPPSGVVMWAN